MRIPSTLLALFFIPSIVFSQESYQLKDLYVTTLDNYFKSTQYNDYVIITDTLVNVLPETIGEKRFSYFSDHNQILTKYKKDVYHIYRLTSKKFGNDTIDVNIDLSFVKIKKGVFIHQGQLKFKKIKFRKIEYCGFGMEEYIPTYRFIITNDGIKAFSSMDIIEVKMQKN